MVTTLLGELAGQSLSRERFEVIVVDDCSTDDTLRAVDELSPSLPYRLTSLGTPTNRGPAAARNLGWRATSAPFVAFLDDDCTPDPGWLEAGLQVMRADPEPGVVQGSTHAPDGAEIHGLTDWYIWRVVEHPTPFFEGCNLFFRRDVLSVTGGFDEDIRYYGEDCAAGWRVLEAGYARAFAPLASVRHPVDRRGFVWFVRNGYLESRLVHCGALHPGFRAAAFWRPWAYRREGPALVVAVVGMAAGLRFRPALLLALPYLWWRRPSVRHLSFFRLCLQVPLVDAARVAGHVRGSMAHRVFVI
jgi:GT2 family glycosyltransferase